MAEAERSAIFSKEMAFVLPLVGTAVSVAYDVGYFSALNINFFTVFSLSEHIVFALEVLPFALLASVSLVVFPVAWEMGRRSARKEAVEVQFPKKKKGFLKKPAFWMDFVFLAYLIGITWYYRNATLFVLLFFFVMISALATWLVEYLLRPHIWVALVSIFCLAVSLAFGFDTATRYRDSKHFLSTIMTQNTVFEGRIVRSGERGLI